MKKSIFKSVISTICAIFCGIFTFCLLNGEIDINKVLEYFPLFINIKDFKNTGEVSKKVAESKQAVHILKKGLSLR